MKNKTHSISTVPVLALCSALLTLGAVDSRADTALGAYFANQTESATNQGILGEDFQLFGPSGSNDLTVLGLLGSNTVTIQFTGAGGSGSTGYVLAPFQGYVYGNDEIDLTFSGLTPGLAYNVAAYSGSGGNLTTVSLPDGTSGVLSSAASADGSAFVNADASNGFEGNYITGQEFADADGKIEVTAVLAGSNPVLSGVGISEIAAAPEPSTYVLGGMGLLVLGMAARRKMV